MAMKAGLRFLAALAPAHLLQNSRDTKALHPVFCRPDSRPVSLSAVFSKASQTFSRDLRIFLTGFDCLAVSRRTANGTRLAVCLFSRLSAKPNDNYLNNRWHEEC